MRIDGTEVQELLAAARLRAGEIGKALSIAIVDVGGYIVAIERMDGARPLTPSIALSKAYSAAVMQRPTSMLKDWSSHDPVFFSQVARLGWQPIVATGGGMTLRRGDEFLGGVGISGGSPQEDEDIARGIVTGLGFGDDFAAWAGNVK